MSEYHDYYKKIGFMCGLEIHQRLATAEKLFCKCPTNIIEMVEKEPMSAHRYQRAVAGEMGLVDVSAAFEQQKQKRFLYKIPNSYSCLVEIDEEPPHEMNREAFMIALSFAKAMEMRIVDEIQPMRKAVVDGSDPSAFQRTAMVGFDGKIKVNETVVNIPSMFLEEESCGIESGNSIETTYSLNRMGVPLVEIDTDPYIRSPKDAKEIALYIGTLMRISGFVQRGIGSVRQDVNVSIKDGARVEIKGLQEIESVDKFIDNEVKRQQELLKIRDQLKKSGASVTEIVDVTDVFTRTKAQIIRNQVDKKGVVMGFRLKGFKGFLGKEISEKRRLGTEISDYAKAANIKGIIHSDEDLLKYGITPNEVAQLSKKLSLGPNDAFIIVAGSQSDARNAAVLAKGRAEQAIISVPLETRGAVTDGTFTTRFLRPLPGGSRMYPETDARPILVTKDAVKEAESNSPNLEKEKAFLMKHVKNNDVVDQLIRSTRLQLFKSLMGDTSADPQFIANVILQKFTELKRYGFDVESISDERLVEMFDLYKNKRITKQAIDEILKSLAKMDQSVNEIVKKEHLERMTDLNLKKLIEKEKKEGKVSKEELRNRIMSKYRLNVDGSELNSLII